MIATNSDVPQVMTEHLAIHSRDRSHIPPSNIAEDVDQHHGLGSTIRFCANVPLLFLPEMEETDRWKLSSFKDFPCNELSRTSPFIKTREHVRRLCEVYASSAAETGKLTEKDGWWLFTVHLRDTKKVIQEFLDMSLFRLWAHKYQLQGIKDGYMCFNIIHIRKEKP